MYQGLKMREIRKFFFQENFYENLENTYEKIYRMLLGNNIISFFF